MIGNSYIATVLDNELQKRSMVVRMQNLWTMLFMMLLLLLMMVVLTQGPPNMQQPYKYFPMLQ